MHNRALRHGPNARHARRALSSPTLWLATTGTIAALASCAGSPNTSSNQPAGAAPSAAPTGAWPAPSAPTPSPTTGSGDAGAGAGSTPDAAIAAPSFDYNVFESTIQPILDTAAGTGCTNTSCHGAAAGIAGLTLNRLPASGSPEMQANFAATKALCNVNVPDQSIFYLKATTSHAGGSSAVVSQAQGSTVLAWIQHASPASTTPTPTNGSDAGASGGAGTDAGPTTGAGCVPASSFNLGLFASEIQPILFGTLDYNVAPGTPVANNGCARSACHGSATNKLNISPTNSPAQNLANIGCFVNLTNPSSSSFLLCPLNEGCPISHPGQDVFASQQDLNYQRLASWLYSAAGAASPLDLAFFARQVAPIFTDPASGGINNGQRTCSDTSTCHGVGAIGQAPPNLSNFPILASASTKQGFQANMQSAAAFTNFFDPQGSELFLFPTNLIANTNQPYETGLPHPGGLDFSPNSPQAQAILQWVSGLQPDAKGDILNWLVAGTYDATLVTQSTEVGNETKLSPTIFDSDGAQQFNGGVWDLDSSANEFVDLNAEFPGSVGSGRVAYAVANLINVSGSDIQQAQVTVQTPNAVLLYVGSASSQGSLAGNNTVSLSQTLPSFSTAKSSTRILVKVLQRPGDAQFGFTLNVAQQNNQTIPPGELLVHLDANGGI
jgi:hypothetical protein